MEFKRGIFQAWKVVENDYMVMESRGKVVEFHRIGHEIFKQKNNHFRSLTVILKEYKVRIIVMETWKVMEKSQKKRKSVGTLKILPTTTDPTTPHHTHQSDCLRRLRTAQ